MHLFISRDKNLRRIRQTITSSFLKIFQIPERGIRGLMIKMSNLSTLGKTVLAIFIVQAIVLTTLECLVVYFHVSFVSNFTLSSTGGGISESDLIYHAM